MAGHPGPAPFMPPPVGSAERDAWEDEVGPEAAYAAKQAWQKWFQAEQKYINDNILFGGKDLEEIETETPGEFYQNVPEKGKANFSRYGRGPGYEYDIDEMHARGLRNAVNSGGLTWDPTIGLYRSGGRGVGRIGEGFRNEKGKAVPGPGAFNPTTGTYGGVSAATYDYNPYNTQVQQQQQAQNPGKVGVTQESKQATTAVRTGWETKRPENGETAVASNLAAPVGAYSQTQAPTPTPQKTNPWGFV